MSWRHRVSQLRTVMGIMHGSRAFGGPFQALLSLTNRCNLRCLHCIFYSPHLERPNLVPVRRARMMSLELPSEKDIRRLQHIDADTDRTKTLVKDLIRMGTRRFQFSGSGEPFLHKNALEFMSLAKHAGGTCLVNTNGTLLDHSTIDALVAMRFDDLQVTTMSGTAGMYRLTHPGCKDTSFDTLRENLLYLAERKRALGIKQPALSLCYVVVAQNHDGIADFADFANIVQADRTLFRPFFDVEDSNLAGLVPSAKEALHVREQLMEVKGYLDRRGISHNIPNFLAVFERKLDTTALYRAIPCYYGWLSALIDADGSVYPCCRCHSPLGDIREMKFEDIWHGRSYQTFRKKAIHINLRGTLVENCDCYRCANNNANFRTYRLLHPFSGSRLDQVWAAHNGVET